MFKIGEFARLSGVSAKTLRHYQRLGLFPPAWVDPASQYRFYSPAQLPLLYRIVALRDLGLPLAEVADLVGGGADVDAALARRRAELQAERAELDRRLAALEIQVDVDGHTRHPDVVVRNVTPELVAGLRVHLDPGEDLGPVFDELEAYVRDAGARATRPPATIVHAEGPPRRQRDVEAVVPLEWRIEPTERIACRRLDADRVACLIQRGPYEGLAAARRTLAQWVATAGLRPSGPLRIVYLQFGADPALRTPERFLTDSAQQFVTELQQPIAAPGTNGRNRPRS